jgi:hypothetical protein
MLPEGDDFSGFTSHDNLLLKVLFTKPSMLLR